MASKPEELVTLDSHHEVLGVGEAAPGERKPPDALGREGGS